MAVPTIIVESEDLEDCLNREFDPLGPSRGVAWGAVFGAALWALIAVLVVLVLWLWALIENLAA